jgi:hypothetical protein
MFRIPLQEISAKSTTAKEKVVYRFFMIMIVFQKAPSSNYAEDKNN